MAEEAVEEEVTEDTQEEAVEESPQEEASEEEATELAEEDISTWRDLIQDEKLAKHAERFTDLEALVKANIDSRKQLSKAVVPPGADADDSAWESYREALGVPKDVDGYDFPLPEGVERTEEMMDGEDKWSNIFLDNNVPKSTADALVAEFRNELGQMQQARIDADAEFTKQSEQSLKQEWGDDYE